ncbi:MAG TPA: dihydrodipicolinate synthase family protein [Bacteroidota bacterium]|nr:dihydrodipicolinate synthase family protein [Bacteroidota bacterium]
MIAQKIRGVYPPMITPFTKEGEVDYAAHKRNVERWNKEELGGYLVLGSNSETPYLNETEKVRLIELTAQYAARGRKIFAGTGLESTRESIRLTKRAAEAGAHAALVLTPSFYGSQMSDDVLIGHFRHIADSSHIPILIYNMPAFTHINVSVAAVGALSRHPNVIGMKDSAGDVRQLEEIMKVVPETFNLIVGTAAAWYPALTLGISAGILALANVAGNQCAMVQKYHEGGEREKARELHEKLLPVNAAVTSTYGIAGLKYAATLLGYDGGCVRSPLLSLTESAQKRIEELLSAAGLLALRVSQ